MPGLWWCTHPVRACYHGAGMCECRWRHVTHKCVIQYVSLWKILGLFVTRHKSLWEICLRGDAPTQFAHVTTAQGCASADGYMSRTNVSYNTSLCDKYKVSLWHAINLYERHVYVVMHPPSSRMLPRRRDVRVPMDTCQAQIVIQYVSLWQILCLFVTRNKSLRECRWIDVS